MIIMFSIDIVWLGTMVKRFYMPQIGHLMSGKVDVFAAIVFYVIYAFGLTFLLSMPALENNYSYTKIFITGAILGLMCYATYNFTNQSTLRSWPTLLSIVDTTWGTLLTGTTGVLVIYILKNIFKF
jgi:uncharacterized membrane protein